MFKKRGALFSTLFSKLSFRKKRSRQRWSFCLFRFGANVAEIFRANRPDNVVFDGSPKKEREGAKRSLLQGQTDKEPVEFRFGRDKIWPQKRFAVFVRKATDDGHTPSVAAYSSPPQRQTVRHRGRQCRFHYGEYGNYEQERSFPWPQGGGSPPSPLPVQGDDGNSKTAETRLERPNAFSVNNRHDCASFGLITAEGGIARF